MSLGGLDMTITVETEDDRSHFVETTPFETVYEVKEKLESVCGTDPVWQTLWVGDLELADNHQLRFYDIANGARLNLMIRVIEAASEGIDNDDQISEFSGNSSEDSGSSVSPSSGITTEECEISTGRWNREFFLCVLAQKVLDNVVNFLYDQGTFDKQEIWFENLQIAKYVFTVNEYVAIKGRRIFVYVYIDSEIHILFHY